MAARTWTNGSGSPLNATNLNALEADLTAAAAAAATAQTAATRNAYPVIVGQSYGVNGTAMSTANAAVGDLRLALWVAPASGTIDQLSFEVTTAGTGGLFRPLLYSLTAGLPVTRVIDFGTAASTTLGWTSTTGTAVAVTQGVAYAIGGMTDSHTTVSALRANNGFPPGMPQPLITGATFSAWQATGAAAGGGPNPLTATLTNVVSYRVVARYATVTS